MKRIDGLPGSRGQAVFRAAVIKAAGFTVEKRAVENAQQEIDRFEQVRREYSEHLSRLYDDALVSLGEDSAKIFKAYKEIAEDDFFFKKPFKAALEEGINADYAVDMEKRLVCEKFAKMDDAYMKERATDICNVCDELIRRVNGIQKDELSLDEPFIAVAEDLTPEDTVRIDKRYLGGFITQKGGVTSHTVILAKTLGIPAIVGASGALESIRDGQTVYINGGEGYCIVEPDEAFIQNFLAEKTKLDALEKIYAEAARGPAVTADGREVSVCVNSGDADSIKTFNPDACDGIGLFRTEFLFMSRRDYPDEELQFGIYREIAEKAGGKEVIIRTLDIGGDKQLDYMDIPKESNPFLGYRAIRICLDRPAVFLTQLRAILRASAYGFVKIMFPMIVNLSEVMKAKALLEQAKDSLSRESLPFDKNVQAGIMIETPASVLISDILAKYVDFFSIGTNDLIQYTTATDRMNEKVQYLYDPYNVSVLRAIETTIRAGHAAGIRVGMCGEMASDEKLIPLLLGMGLDEFSVAPSLTGRVKHLIGKLNYGDLSQRAKSILELESEDGVKEALGNL